MTTNVIDTDMLSAIQLGRDIDGESVTDLSGWSVALSADGSVVAIGAHLNDGNGSNSGQVRLYRNNGDTWDQIGSDIDGEFAGDQSGYSVSLSADGSVVAIGAIGNDINGTDTGHVRIYQNTNDVWEQIGSDIDGEAFSDQSGYSVSLSADGSVVAIGAVGNDGNGISSGQVRLYQNNGGVWEQIGGDIDGEMVGDQSGQSVSLSADGSVVAIGAPLNDGNGSSSGQVRLYQNNGGVWEQIGDDIDGEFVSDQSGYSVSLSADGSIVAIGAYLNNGNGNDSGQVRIYQNNGGVWEQIGSDINGEAAFDQSGYSVSLSADGSVVAIGAIRNDGNGTDSGHVRIYQRNGEDWIQIVSDLDGEAASDLSGRSVALSADGSVVAIGAYLNDGNGSNSGHVRLYRIGQTGAEDTSFAITGLSVSDPDDTLATTQLSVDHGTLTVTLAGGATISGGENSSNSLTLSGSAADINGTLASLSYQGDSNYFGGDLLTLISTDANGTSDTDTLALTITRVDDDVPVNTLPGTVTVNEDESVAIAGLSVTDPDNNLATTQLSVENGTLTVTLAGATTISAGEIGSSSLTFSGSEADINATLASLVYQGDSNYSGTDTLTIVSTDSGGTPLSDTDTLAITVTSVDNDAPKNGIDFSTFVATQIGDDIDGESPSDRSGYSVSLSADGSIVAIGATSNSNGNGLRSGHVRVYQNTRGVWAKIGSDIEGEITSDESGWSVALSADGSVVAIGAINNDGNGTSSGHVRIYQNNGGDWEQIGDDIDGEASSDISGFSVTLSADGSVVAIGAPRNDGNGRDSGHVRIYRNNDGAWEQVGGDINGEFSDDQSGYSVSLSTDASLVAIGAVGNDANGSNSGQVRVYQNNGEVWEQVGNDIDGEATNDQSGYSVSLSSDGSTVAIGAYLNDDDGNGSNSGHVRIYQNNDGVWEQVGSDIDGEAAGDRSGQSVALSADGSIVAIGADLNDANGSNSGHVRLYQNNDGVWEQIVSDIDGEALGDRSGQSVSLSDDGTVVAIGAFLNDGNGSDSGHVRLYRIGLRGIEDTPLPVTGLSVSDPDGNLATTQVSVDHGSLTVSLVGGATVSAGANSSNTLTLSGSEADINATLASLIYQGDSDYFGDDTLTLVSTDANGISDSDTVALTVTRVDNDAPTNNLPAPVVVNEDESVAIVDLSVTDPDGNLATTQVSVSHGTLTVILAGATTISTGENGSASFTLSGSEADINTTLASLVYQGLPNYAGTDTLTIVSSDTTDTPLTTTDTLAITVNSVDNDAPKNTIDVSSIVAIQIGDDIEGEVVFDNSGYSVSLSADGSVVAIGATGNDGRGISSGHVRIYQSSSGNWKQIGGDIDGEAVSDTSGYSVAVSADGNVVAIGAINNDGNGSDSGHVRIYQNNEGVWEQIGSDIDGEAASDNSGRSVALSADGSVVAIGANGNDGNGSDSGHVRIYQNNGGVWTQIGDDIEGEASDDNSGWSVSLSADGAVVAIGAYLNDGNGSNSGHVRIYQNNGGVWTQIGDDIDGEASDDNSGGSVSLSADGAVVAIGARRNDGNGSLNGHVRLYQNNGGVWTQIGDDIDGEAASDFSGQSVFLSADGSVVAIGAVNNDGNGSSSGHVRLYQNNDGIWQQIGGDIDGEASSDSSGWSVSLSADGSVVAIGAVNNDGNGGSSGHVRLYRNGQSEAEDTPLAITALSVSDADGNLVTTELSVGHGTLTVTLAGDTTIGAGVNGSNSFTLSGSEADINATLATLIYQGDANYFGGDTLTMVSTDANGISDTDTLALNITPVDDDAPVNTLPAPVVVNEDEAVSIIGLNVTDPDGNLATTQVSVEHGILAVTLAGTTTISAGKNESNSLTFSGSEADINATLATLVYQGDPDYFGTDTLTIVSTDTTGIPLSDTDTLAITVTPVDNDVPQNAINFSSFVAAQIGDDIDGELPSDQSGYSVSLSADGSVVAIGAIGNDGNGGNSGHVRIYQNVNGDWEQIGSDINGEAPSDQSGWSLALSTDGSIIAIGAPNNDGNGLNSGHVRLYQNNGGDWEQIGSDIDGETSSDQSGFSVSLSADGSVVAIGAPRNDGLSTDSGQVRIYQNNGQGWEQIGSDIDGETSSDQSGYSISLSADGSVVAIGAIGNRGNGTGSGHVRIYQNNNGVWEQIGSDIDGEASSDRSGYSVSLSADGSVVAIGAYLNDGNGGDSGHVRIYQNNGGVWEQIGSDIDGEAASDLSGSSVALSADGSVVAIGAILNDDNGNESGHVRLYQNNGGVWEQIAGDIDGEAAGDRSGHSVALSDDGSVVAIGAHLNDDNGGSSGQVRLYRLVQSGIEDTPFAIEGLSVSDVDGNLATTQISVDHGTLTVTLAGAVTISDGTNGSSSITLSGSEADINATLASLSYQGNANYSGADTLTLTSTDANGLSDTDTVAISITPVDEAPINAIALEPPVISEDTPISLTGLSVNDIDANLATTQLSVEHGTLIVTLAGTATISAGTNGSNSLTLSGSEADINTTLTTLIYQGDTHYNGPDTLTFISSDASGNLSDTETLAITITPVDDDAPINTLDVVSSIVDEDVSTALTGISVTDPDGNLATTQLTVEQGTLSVTLAGTATITGGENNSNSLTLSGSETDINNTLNSLVYQGNADYNGADTLTMFSTDASDVPLSTTNTLAITVAPINDGAPSLDLNGVDDFGNNFFTGLSSPAVIAAVDSDLTLTDVDDDPITTATITLTNPLNGLEFLVADASGTNITADYGYDGTSQTGVLTLSGTDTLANYQQVLRTVQYGNFSSIFSTPILTPTARTLQFTVNDGNADSPIATTTIILSNSQAPAVPVITGISSDTGSSDSDGLTNDTTPDITGTAEPDITIEVFIDDTFIGTTVADNSGNWVLSLPSFSLLIDGSYIVTAIARKSAGLTSEPSDAFAFTIDTTPATLTTLIPADDSTGVVIETSLTMTFDEDIQAGNGVITIKRLTDNSVIESIDVTSDQITISGSTVTVTPTSDLPGGQELYVEISGGTLQDLAGNDIPGLSDSMTWNFITLNDVIGTEGPDILEGTGFDDQFDGLGESDRIRVVKDTDFIATEGTLLGAGTDTFSNIEILQLAGGSSDNILDGAALTITRAFFNGSAGDDRLIGGAANDILNGGPGADTFNSGGGDDNLRLGVNDLQRDIVNYTLGDGSDIIREFERGVGGDSLNFSGINEIDVIIQNGDTQFRLANPIFGTGEKLITVRDITTFSSDDVGVNLTGATFNFEQTSINQIIGTEGPDILQGTDFDDNFDGLGDSDRARSSQDADFIATEGTLVGAGNDTFSNIEILQAVGGNSDNILDASALITTRAFWVGREGNDTLIGGNADDILWGGIGDDVFDGGNGQDRLREVADADFTATEGTLTGLGNDTFTNIEILQLIGQEGNNRFDGSALSTTRAIFHSKSGNDILMGGNVNDVLIGDDGADELTGNGGNDTLRLGVDDGDADIINYQLGDGKDTVFEFELGIDLLQITGVTSIDVVVTGSNTQFREASSTFGRGALLMTVRDVVSFSATDVGTTLLGSPSFNF